MASTSDVLDHHLKCFGERDVDGTLSDYSEALLFIPTGPLKGPGDQTLFPGPGFGVCKAGLLVRDAAATR
jgi:hypothetical protein